MDASNFPSVPSWLNWILVLFGGSAGLLAFLKSIGSEGWSWKKQRHAETREDNLTAESFLREQLTRLDEKLKEQEEKAAAYEPRMEALKKRAEKGEADAHKLRLDVETLQHENNRLTQKVKEQSAIIASLRERLEKC